MKLYNPKIEFRIIFQNKFLHIRIHTNALLFVLKNSRRSRNLLGHSHTFI